MYQGISYYFVIGIINLIYLTYQDYKHNRMVDDRKNYFMMGVAFSLISHVPVGIWYLLALVFVILLINIMMTKFKVFGGADINSFTWIFYGLGILHPLTLLTFTAILLFNTTIFMALRKVYSMLMRVEVKPMAYYGVILLSFVLNAFLFGALF